MGVRTRDPQPLEAGEGAQEGGSRRGRGQHSSRAPGAPVSISFSVMPHSILRPLVRSVTARHAGVGSALGSKVAGSPAGGEAGQGRGGVVTTSRSGATLEAFSSQQLLSWGLDGTTESNVCFLLVFLSAAYHVPSKSSTLS